MLFAGVVLTGCAARPREPAPDSLDPDPPIDASAMKPIHTNLAKRTVIGESIRGQPIEMFAFDGDLSNAVLVIGGIHGNEPTSVDVARELVALLESQPALAAGRHVAVIVSANPDALAAKRRTNARGIDINRNFAASNFKQGRRGMYGGGTRPLSEPESKAIAQVVAQLRPRLLISVHSIERGRHCNNYDGPAQSIADIMSSKNGYPSKDTIGYPTPGSLGSWAGQDLQIPMITLELPRDLSGEQVWRENKEALVAALSMVEQ
jgi:protein MpaA